LFPPKSKREESKRKSKYPFILSIESTLAALSWVFRELHKNGERETQTSENGSEEYEHCTLKLTSAVREDAYILTSEISSFENN
jgi:hypothetical protein